MKITINIQEENLATIKELLEKVLVTYTMTDQPETCEKCGARTEFIGERVQLHKCLNCGYVFLVDESW